ncbi:hypothetical protein H0H93_004995 [Arthromyces matolae]|nr:hypothetical protein H0H93_004995 [Arthromyces matolae]
MAKVKKKTPTATSDKETVPSVAWTADSHALTWLLINELEKPENRKVIIGKLKNENSSGDHKIQAYKRVAQQVLPAIFEVDAGIAANRVKGKWENLRKTYSTHAKRLYQTGAGIKDSQEPDEYSLCYVPPEGPNENTTFEAKNIWDEIKLEFEFFPRLHGLLSTRPNVTPIAVTTGVGPYGRKTVHYQAPENYQTQSTSNSRETIDAHIDPCLRNLDLNLKPLHIPSELENIISLPLGTPTTLSPPTSEFSTPVGGPGVPMAVAPPTPVPHTPARGPKGSTFESTMLDAAVAKASSTIKRVPQKRSIEETFVTMHKRTLKVTEARLKEEAGQKRRKLDLAERELRLQEFKAGLITVEEYRSLTIIKPSSSEDVIVIADSSDVEYEDVKPVIG